MPAHNPQVVADTIWIIFAGALVFLMNAGSDLLETGRWIVPGMAR